MMFFFLSCNYFIRSSIIKVRLIFIKIDKSIDPLESNLKRAEAGIVPVDKYHEIL